MKNPLLWKAVALFVLVLVLMIPLSMVSSAIAERALYHEHAQRDIARSWGGEQQVIGPLLVQSYEVLVEAEVWDKNLEAYVEKSWWEARQQVAFPERLDIQGDVRVEQRYRGIHAVPVYRAELRMETVMNVPAAPVGARNVRHHVVVAVGDTRGFRQQPVITWQDEPLPVLAGTHIALPSGVSASPGAVEPGRYAVSVDLALGGTNALALAPVGDDTQVTLQSNWPHPSFGGGYLPDSRAADAAGFSAAWKTSHYATTIRESVNACIQEAQCAFNPVEFIGVALADPVNVYLLNERAVKYGLLFVLVVFGVFLVFELLKRLRIHPVQYGMVGLGQAIFFLLLLSLSEHLAFGLAYLLGAGACVVLLAAYVARVLGGWASGLRFGVLLGVIYGALYVILNSEDHALLLGSVLLFGLLAAAMYLTRNVNWYAIELPGRGSAGPVA